MKSIGGGGAACAEQSGCGGGTSLEAAMEQELQQLGVLTARNSTAPF